MFENTGKGPYPPIMAENLSDAARNTRLTPEQLRPTNDPQQIGAASSRDLEPVNELVGQDRALEAMKFGATIRHDGYNLYVLVPEASTRHKAIIELIEAQKRSTPSPDDWVYVHNFQTDWKPQAIRLPAGTAKDLSAALIEMVDDLRSGIPALFESEEYKERRRKIDESSSDVQEQSFEQLRQKAQAQNIGILRTPMGFALAPLRDGKVVKPDEFNALPETEREEIQKQIQVLQDELAEILSHLPDIEKQRRDQIRALNAELAATLVDRAVSAVAAKFKHVPQIIDRLDAISRDMVDNTELFLAEIGDREASPFPVATAPVETDPRYRRYLVNIMVAQESEAKVSGVPIVYEDYPSLGRLVGYIEHESRMGTLVTDFSLIRPGALHRANGGYLILDARKLLMEPWSYEALKRALRSDKIAITSAAEQLGFARTTMLEPEPIDLDVKIILIGERIYYYMLTQLDPDFSELFKVQVDFNDEFERTPENSLTYARLVATIAGKEKLKPFDASAIAAIMDESLRISGDAERLTLRLNRLTDLMREADHWSDHAGRDHVTAQDVQQAIGEQTRRADRVREKSHEAITRRIQLIDTEGKKVGQINGLSVLQLGNFSFGQPSRITARVRMGSGQVIDIEREIKLGGPIHSKGVLILSSYLAANFATSVPMSLWASLVFEQSYGGVEGDSASCAELFALLSALSECPIRQDFAVTGSVNQLGEVQAIGGVNDKIEGFFDICNARGLTGTQGVLIPKSNLAHLVLRDRVVEAVSAGKFHIHAITEINEGIEILTGTPAGTRGSDGRYPADSINGRVEARLEEFAQIRRKFAVSEQDKKNG